MVWSHKDVCINLKKWRSYACIYTASPLWRLSRQGILMDVLDEWLFIRICHQCYNTCGFNQSRQAREATVYVLAISWRGVCTVSLTVWRYLFGVSSQWLLDRQVSPHVCTVWYCTNSPLIYTFTYAYMWYYCHAPYMNYFSCSKPELEYLRQGKIDWVICEKQPNQFYIKGLCL